MFQDRKIDSGNLKLVIMKPITKYYATFPSCILFASVRRKEVDTFIRLYVPVSGS